MTNVKQKYLSTTEFAKFFGISRQYVHKLILQNKIKAIKIGTRWRISQQEFERVKKEGV